LSPKAIIDAQLSGLNTLYLLSSSISETQRETLREYDVEFSETGSLLLDAFSHPAASSPSTVLLSPTSCLKHNGPLLSNSTLSGGPIVFPSGAVHSLGQNPYLVEVAHAPKTAYVGDGKLLMADDSAVEAIVGGKTKGPIVGGRKASLVSALQTRDNARIGFVGSGAVFSDEYWGKKVKTVDGKRYVVRSSQLGCVADTASLETGNAAFAEDFSKWIFQESGVIKVVSSTHHRDDETEPRDQYTKKDQVVRSPTSTPFSPIWS
jgi:oligosaccharyltransferase complex subunit beta